MFLVYLAFSVAPHASAQFADRFINDKSYTTPLRVANKGSDGPGICRSTGNPLEGKPLRYLIGGQAGQGSPEAVTEVSYETKKPVPYGLSIGYINLFEEYNTGKYGPYLKLSSTAAKYNEGQIDPKGPGFEKNLREQLVRRKGQGFTYVELDNPDAYHPRDVLRAYDLAASYGFKIIAKNPGISDGDYDNTSVVAHPAVVAIIVENGAGNPKSMDAIRRKAGKPNIPVWFVGFGNGKGWTNRIAKDAEKYCNMGVTYSSAGEYGNSIDVVVPKPVERSQAAPQESGTGMR